jgi:Zn finger protein HypA/HybF involved in hydrogenase expression
MYKKIAESHESLIRGKVWCKTCGKELNVDSATCLREGWPKCCGYTMTIDHPDTWRK